MKTSLETLKFDYALNAELHPSHLFRVLEEYEARLTALEAHPAVSIPPLTPYVEPRGT